MTADPGVTGTGAAAAAAARGARRPAVWSIAAHRGFADALVAGLIPRYREEGLGLARLTLLLPSHRAVRTVTEAFVRASGEGAGGAGGGNGLLLPRMVTVGDLDLDETLGPLLDPLGAEVDVPPAVDPVVRLLHVAQILREESGPQDGDGTPPGMAGLLRRARLLCATMDRLGVEGIGFERLLDDSVVGLVGDLAGHWRTCTRQFAVVSARWQATLATLGACDATERRNRLLDHAVRRWRERPPPHGVVAAGVTSAAPAVARLLRVVADLPRGAVVLPDLDLALDPAVWDALGQAGAAAGPGESPFGRDDAFTHPQYHLKLLLNRMGIARDEVEPWHRAGPSAAPPARSRAISSLFLPPAASVAWATLPAAARRLSGVRLMQAANPEEEAQAIAVLVRQALAVPERRVAVVTPDRTLAQRVVAHLSRWGIAADDSAGRPLSQTVAGRLLLLLAEVWASRAAPVELIALLGHPLVRAGDERAQWLDHVRTLDRVLRGPRPGPGLPALRTVVADHAPAHPEMPGWWDSVSLHLAPLLAVDEPLPLTAALALLSDTAEALGGQGVWAQADGRAAAAFVTQWSEAAAQVAAPVAPAELPALLRDAMDAVAVRPPYGGHPRLAVYGLLEARMARADLVICGGLVEGTWPAAPAPDPLLAPAVLRALGIPGADFRIGLAAHDLAGALGAPEVVLSHALRDAGGPAIPSRFLLRIRAMLGDLVETDRYEEREAISWARALAKAPPAPAYARPQPCPTPAQRRVDIAVTALDRLRGDPYQFYAQAILGLRKLEPLDADPGAAWQGTAVHTILERWHDAGAPPGELVPVAERALADMSAHPFMRALWQPRLTAALAWIDAELDSLRGEGREVLAWETKGAFHVDGVRIHGRADRIDRCADGTLAIVDYKTGKPPSAAMVEQGFALQLGLIGLMAQAGGIKGVAGDPGRFEYWSLKKTSAGTFGFREEPLRTGNRRSGLAREDLLPETLRYLREAIARWITGTDPFTARENPDLAVYSDYDQLMRLDEWQGRVLRADEA